MPKMLYFYEFKLFFRNFTFLGMFWSSFQGRSHSMYRVFFNSERKLIYFFRTYLHAMRLKFYIRNPQYKRFLTLKFELNRMNTGHFRALSMKNKANLKAYFRCYTKNTYLKCRGPENGVRYIQSS